MTEKFLSFLWKYRLYNAGKLLVDGCPVEVIYPGELNLHSGPDFFNAKLKIGDTVWAGNLEIHQRSSDWNKHGHDKNPAFDNVILHIVGEDDQLVYTSKNRLLATVTLDFDKSLLFSYDTLMANAKWIPCADHLPSVDPIVVSSLFSKIGVERLEFRSSQILANLDQTINDWEEAFYRQIAKSYGFHVNAQPFEALAKSLPYSIIKKHYHDLFQLEALLFGQAGFLFDDYSDDDYYKRLKEEYVFFRVKYDLKPIDVHIWKFMRLRPGNFPTIRLAQLAALISNQHSLFSTIIGANDVPAALQILSVNISSYWNSHYIFGKPSGMLPKPMGAVSASTILVNTIVPFYFIYGKKLGLPEYQDKAMAFLEKIKAEDNSIVKLWKKHNVKPANAFDSQALLHLKNEYCDKKRCLDCGIGVKIITQR